MTLPICNGALERLKNVLDAEASLEVGVINEVLHDGKQVDELGFSAPLGLADVAFSAAAPDMGLAPGGRMKQEIFDDPHSFDVWDTRMSARCFVHITNSLAWRAVTGEEPPTTPLTSREYQEAGLPWFEGGKRISSVPHQRLVVVEEPADHVHGDREGDTVPDLLGSSYELGPT